MQITTQLVDERQAAKILAVSIFTLRDWRMRRPDMLPYVKVGKSVRYKTADLEQFIESRTVGATNG